MSNKKDARLIWVKIRAHVIPLRSRHFLDRTEKSIPSISMLYPFQYHAKFLLCGEEGPQSGEMSRGTAPAA